MAYTPREIKDRVAVGDDIFIVEDLGDNRVRLIPAPTHVLEVGTPVNKALLQPIENYLATGVVPVERTITAGNGLSGGGSLTTNRTLSLGTPGTLSGATSNNVTSTSHTHAISVATKAEAEAGTNNTKLMTPLRVADALNTIRGALFPRGGIIMWSGSINNIPAGWALCDGSNGTPDLRDRFIVGAGGSYNVGSTGGANSVALNTNQIPSHNHGAGDLKANSAGSHTHDYRTNSSTSSASGIHSGYLSGSTTRQTSSGGAHTHTISGNTSNTGGGQAHENRPPYYALCFIMKL